MSSIVKMAVVGLGYWGPNIARNISSCKQTELAWLCDSSQDRLSEYSTAYASARVTMDIDDVLDSDVDAVAIATPVHTHFELARKCMAAKKHVFLEKPMTRTVAEAEELTDIARTNHLTLMIDHTFNYTSAVTKIKEIVSSNTIGDILYWDSVRVNLGLFQHDVNVIWDLAPHDLSIMDYVLDEKPISVSAFGVAHYKEGIEDIAYLTLHFNQKLIAHFHFNWLSPVKVRQTLIGGKLKMIAYDDMENSEKVKIYDKGVYLGNTREGLYNALVQYRMGEMNAPHLPNKEALRVALEHFAGVIRNNENPVSGPEAGLRVVKILEAAQKSIDNKGMEISV